MIDNPNPNWQTFSFCYITSLHIKILVQVLRIPQGSLSTNNARPTPLIGSALCVCEWCSAQQLRLASWLVS